MLIPVVVESVRVHVLTQQHVVLLQERDSGRLLPIWIGPDMAHSIATRLAGIASERPLTHDLVLAMLQKIGAEVTRVVVRDLIPDDQGGGTFLGSIFLQVGEQELEFDARPSDAIALAVRTGVPIFATDAVLDRAAVVPEGEDDEKLSVFREFVNSLNFDLPGD